jgi:hypothetical protein
VLGQRAAPGGLPHVGKATLVFDFNPLEGHAPALGYDAAYGAACIGCDDIDSLAVSVVKKNTAKRFHSILLEATFRISNVSELGSKMRPSSGPGHEIHAVYIKIFSGKAFKIRPYFN